MKKEVFIRLFKIEDSLVVKINIVNDDLIIKVETDVQSFAMGNNIRENDYHCVENLYTFKNISNISSDSLLNIRAIYNTFYIECLICFDTNLGKIYFDCNEVLVK